MHVWYRGNGIQKFPVTHVVGTDCPSAVYCNAKPLKHGAQQPVQSWLRQSTLSVLQRWPRGRHCMRVVAQWTHLKAGVRIFYYANVASAHVQLCDHFGVARDVVYHKPHQAMHAYVHVLAVYACVYVLWTLADSDALPLTHIFVGDGVTGRLLLRGGVVHVMTSEWCCASIIPNTACASLTTLLGGKASLCTGTRSHLCVSSTCCTISRLVLWCTALLKCARTIGLASLQSTTNPASGTSGTMSHIADAFSKASCTGVSNSTRWPDLCTTTHGVHASSLSRTTCATQCLVCKATTSGSSRVSGLDLFSCSMAAMFTTHTSTTHCVKKISQLMISYMLTFLGLADVYTCATSQHRLSTSMKTQFSWIDAAQLPQLGNSARAQPLRDTDGVPTPGGLVCPTAANSAMAISLCVPVVNPMYTAWAHHVAVRTCGGCGSYVHTHAAKCNQCDEQPVPKTKFDADAVERSQWTWSPDKPSKKVLVMRHVVAPALFARPTSTMPDGRPSDDDLTKHLATIVRIDNRCRQTAKMHGSESSAHAAARHQLQRAVHNYFGFKPPGKSKGDARYGQPGINTGLKFRLNGKTGRMRASLLGWRLGEVARCVAQPAPPGVEVDVVIVPQTIAAALGGLKDGAVCLLNRQPTLGVGSIFAVRARVSRNPRSFAIQVSPWLCATLNLDFDGDEVNLHAIKSRAAQYEARLLCGVDSITRCRITRKVRVRPTHSDVVANWLQPSTHFVAAQQGPAVRMLEAMAACSEHAEATLRRNAVTVGLSDVKPVPCVTLAQLRCVPKSQHVAHLAQSFAKQPPGGGLGALVQSRAKGKYTHLVQLKVRLGQQLRWSKKHSTAGGYIDRCFAQGLTVEQAVDHAMSARVGQVDQAVKTRTVGYLRRRLVALMENVTIEHDGTTRLTSNKVVQFKHSPIFEPGDAAGSLCANMIGHAAFQASLDAFKHTDANSHSAPGLPAFLDLVAAPKRAAGAGHWQPHNAANGEPAPWVSLKLVGAATALHKVTKTDVMVRRVMGWSPELTDASAPQVVHLNAAAMLAHNVSVGDVAVAVRRAFARHGRPGWDCTVTSCGTGLVLWNGASWPRCERVTGCEVLPSTIPCATQAQRVMQPCHVTSCCVATMSVLGVEAARQHFVCMTTHHLGLRDARAAVELMADTLFWPGYQLPLSRNGLQQQLPEHALCRAAYETTLTVFADAATKGCTDPGTTISSRVCRRQPPRLGSNGPCKIFCTSHGVVENQQHGFKPEPRARANPRPKTRATYEVFDFLSAQNNDTSQPVVKKPRISRWGCAPWTSTLPTGCFARPML